jgi:hypothetical protein
VWVPGVKDLHKTPTHARLGDIVYDYFVGALGPKKFVSPYHLRQPGANSHCPPQPFCN